MKEECGREWEAYSGDLSTTGVIEDSIGKPRVNICLVGINSG